MELITVATDPEEIRGVLEELHNCLSRGVPVTVYGNDRTFDECINSSKDPGTTTVAVSFVHLLFDDAESITHVLKTHDEHDFVVVDIRSVKDTADIAVIESFIKENSVEGAGHTVMSGGVVIGATE